MLSTIHKHLALPSIFILLISVQACSAEETKTFPTASDVSQCFAARNGELGDKILHKVVEENNAHRNAYLFDCAVQVNIGEADTTKAMRKNALANKQKVANKLLALKLDVNYVNEYNNTLLMTVVSSFLDEKWKLNTAKKLIDMGVDLNHVNKFKKTALELAKVKKDVNLIRLLDHR